MWREVNINLPRLPGAEHLEAVCSVCMYLGANMLPGMGGRLRQLGI